LLDKCLFVTLRSPDFFILGAPKCGTSALYTYLAAHPGIYMPANKEPHFYADDMYTRDVPFERRKHERQSYLALFAEAPQGALTGEGSTWYLFSERAVPNILADNPAARFIVMLRHPVDMAHSLHAHNLRKLYEEIPSLEAAWAARAARAEGRQIPHFCPEPKMLNYWAACSFAPQLERLFGQVPRDQVLVHIYEEFFANPKAGYELTLAFLGLSPDGRKTFERVNVNQALRSRALRALVDYRPFPLNFLYPPVKQVANALGLRPGKAMFEWNLKEERRRPLDSAFRRRLEVEFRPDIERLEVVLGRRLDVWTSAESVAD
jgi:hypothetical protein